MTDETADDIYACAAAALASMREYDLPPTPCHYAIWFEYHAGRHLPLRRALSVALSNRRRIDSRMMAELYDLFLAGGSERQAAQEVRAMLVDAKDKLDRAGADAKHYGSTLREAVGEMQRSATPRAEVIRRLAEETAAISAKSSRLSAELAASSRRIAELEQQLAAAHKASMTDALTSLPNRRAFDAMVLEQAGRAMNTGAPLALLMLDIDHFKRINDTWGHTVGDAVIRHVGQTIAQHIVEPACAARYGGEEFAVLLPGLGLDAAVAHAEGIRRTLAQRRLSLRANAESIGQVTVSIGAAVYEPGEPIKTWIERADAALYDAKRQGRNRVAARSADVALAG